MNAVALAIVLAIIVLLTLMLLPCAPKSKEPMVCMPYYTVAEMPEFTEEDHDFARSMGVGLKPVCMRGGRQTINLEAAGDGETVSRWVRQPKIRTLANPMRVSRNGYSYQ